MWYAHRDEWLGWHSEHSLYIALHFPNAFPEGCAWDIQGWFWGKPMCAKSRSGTIWLNFTEPGKKYVRTDDLQVALDTLTADNYGTLWAVVAPKSFGAAVAVPAAPAPADAPEDTVMLTDANKDAKSAEDKSGA